MESIIVSNSSLKGKCFSCLETSVSLVPSDTSLKALSSCCLFGKVIAPMVVEEINVTDFVAKTWKIPVSVAAVVDEVKSSNVFKFGFECAEHRNWAMENGPWCVRGYSLVLRAWTPTVDGPVAFNLLRAWIQIHNLPHEYFSKANGCLLGGLVGKVVQVELDEGKPAAWCNFLKVLVDIDVEKPLFSSYFFDVASTVKKWIQVKYEKISIFCYFCGSLGHQRRGCKLTSPVTVSNSDGIPFPMFGPWLSTLSSYQCVFPGPNSIASRRLPASLTMRKNGGDLLLLPASMEDGAVEQRGSPASQSLRSRRPAMWTSHGAAGLGKSTRTLQEGKKIEDLPVLEMNNMDQRILNVMTVGEDKRNDGLIFDGPLVVDVGLADHQKSKGKSPLYQNLNLNNNVSGPPSSSKKNMQCGPELVETFGIDNNTKSLEGLSNLDMGSNDIGSNPPSLNDIGLVGVSSNLPRETNGPEEHANEAKALAQFFKAQESLLHDLKHFGNLDLYEIRNIGGDIGVPASSKVNERTTPFKKQKFEASASLWSRPHKVPLKYPDVVRDFPWDTRQKENDLDLVIDDPSEDNSSSLSCSGILKNPLVGSFVIDDTVSSGSSDSHNPVEENVESPPQEP
uniref:CCHC-type domain-containing protein n=1 Tax=Cannabis sativa TaxID=3483 RepID=A0A803NG83_CANSA